MQPKTRRAAWVLAALALIVVTAASCGGKPRPALVTRSAAKPPIIIRNVGVFDGVGSLPASDVLMNGGVIVRIAPTGMVQAPSDAVTIDGAGGTLVPGLVDMHGHVEAASEPAWQGKFPDPDLNMQRYLYCGVTTVFDPAGSAPDMFDRRDAVARGELLGPRIFTTGPMFTTPGGHPLVALEQLVPWYLRWYVKRHFVREVATEDDARRAVADLAKYHPDGIKIAVDAVPLGIPIMAPAVIHAIVEEGRARGIRAVAHIGTTADALAAADAGVAAWVHGVYKERIPDDMIPRFAAARIPQVATIAVFEAYADVAEGKRQATALERQIEDGAVLDAFAPVPPNAASPKFQEFFRLLIATRDARRDNVRRLHAAGVPILAGSDTQSGVYAGAGLHRELALLVESGLTPAEALKAATLDGARFVTRKDDPPFGVLREGKAADAVLVDGDPLQDIAAMSRIRDVFLGGVRLERHPVAGAPST